MIIEPSEDYEGCVLISWEAIGPYFSDLGMTWEHKSRLELFKQAELFKVKDQMDVGFFMVWMRDGKFFIADIHVYKKMRNQGFGEKIIARIKELAASRGMYRVWLRVFKANPAVRLYQRSGFHIEVEEQNGYLMSSETNP